MSTRKILILGPDEVLNTQLSERLARAGFQVDRVGNEIGELRKASQQAPPTIVLLNTHMREGWGFDLLNALAILFSHSALYVIGHGFWMNACAMRGFGVSCFMTPDLSTDQLVTHILGCMPPNSSDKVQVS